MDRFLRYRQELDALTENSNLRSLPVAKSKLIDLCSNDYLSIGSNFELQRDFLESHYGENLLLSASSSRLLSGTYGLHLELEQRLEQLYGRPALTFSTGYQMNCGILPALSNPRVLIVADKLAHASIIDGMKLSSATYHRFAHQNLAHLERIIERNYGLFDEIIVVVESIYSMDGDCADIASLVKLKARYSKVMLYVDEAHAVGVRGKGGLGLCEELGCVDDIDILCGTFGKALGSIGGFAVCSATLKEYLVNRMRTFIYTTALPPINAAWSLYVLDYIGELAGAREHLDSLTKQLIEGLMAKGLATPSMSHIVPIIIGDSTSTVAKARELESGGFHTLAVRPPTVPNGTSRLRLSLNSSLSSDDIVRLLELL